jgi:phosphoribosylglycinamide formyltransferase 1
MTPAPELALAIVISGRGSNMAAIAQACARGMIGARVVRVIADRPDAGGIAVAHSLGLQTTVVAARDFADRAAFEQALGAAIDASGAGLVILAGFMKILSPEFAQRYAGAMLNIHPSLLPKFPGLHTHQRVLEAGDREHGASVHFVTGELDAGPVVLQARVPVLPDDTAGRLSARVQQQEYIIYPEAIGLIAAGRLRLAEGKPYLDGQPLGQPLVRSSGAAPS